MRKRKKKAIPDRRVFQYIRSRLGFAGQNGVSIYGLATAALKQDGKHKPVDMNEKQWTFENAAYIMSQTTPKPKKQPTILPKTSNQQIAEQIRSAKYKDFTDNKFLMTFDWRQLRMKVIKHYGAKCMCCGATPETGAVINVDHIKPRKTHPELALSFENLQVLCDACNHGKGNWDTTDWRPKTV